MMIRSRSNPPHTWSSKPVAAPFPLVMDSGSPPAGPAPALFLLPGNLPTAERCTPGCSGTPVAAYAGAMLVAATIEGV